MILPTPYENPLTADHLNALVQEYIASSLAFCEQARSMMSLSDEKRDAIDSALTEAIELTQLHLLRRDYSDMQETADELLQAHGLPVSTTSPEYHRLCRELLMARQGLLLTELDRNDGNYWGEHLSTSVLAGLFAQQNDASASSFITLSQTLPGRHRNL
jgi:hypothetical protein